MTARPPAAAPTPPSATTSSRSTPTSPPWRCSSSANLPDPTRSGSRGAAGSARAAWPPPSPTRSPTPPAAASAPCRSPSTDSYDEGVVSSSPVRKSPGRRKDQQVGALARRRGGADQQRRRHSWRYPMRFKSLDRLPRRTRQRARREDRGDGRFAARYDKQHVDTAAQMVSHPDGLITTRCIYWLIDCAERPDLRLASLSLNELGARAERRLGARLSGAPAPVDDPAMAEQAAVRPYVYALPALGVIARYCRRPGGRAPVRSSNLEHAAFSAYVVKAHKNSTADGPPPTSRRPEADRTHVRAGCPPGARPRTERQAPRDACGSPPHRGPPGGNRPCRRGCGTAQSAAHGTHRKRRPAFLGLSH